MFLRFTKFSRPKFGLIIALLVLFAPALVVATVESAPQRNKAVPTPKKKATPSPKKTQAKTKAAPASSKSKSNPKNARQSDSKKSEKTSAKTNRKNDDRKTADKRNQKQTLAANNKTGSRNSKTDRSGKTADKNRTSSKNARQPDADKKRAASKNTRAAVRSTSLNTTERKTKSDRTNKKSVDETVESDASVTDADSPQIIVTTFSAPLKSQAKADSAILSNVKLGTVLKVTGKNPAWYKVQYAAGGKTSTGWISANAVNDLNADGKLEIYRRIVERNYQPQMDFEAASEFYEFTSKVGAELDSSDRSADIELKRLLALRTALKTIPIEKTGAAPYKEFLKSQEKEIVYNEPAGQWLVASNRFWDLHSKYKKSSAADAIAWEAANNPLPGECEGYVNCYLFDMRMRFGEYLNLHPDGRKAPEALKNLSDYLAPIVADSSRREVYQGPTDVTDRAEFNNLLAELRTIIARLPFAEKENALRQLRTIAEAYR